jgi:diacylglycerol kinase (ATP)
MIQVKFIVNSTCKLSKKAKLAIQLCCENEFLTCTFSRTNGPKHAIDLAKKAVVDGSDVIVAVGGDGTCNEVVNGMMKEVKCSSKFAIIPNGTGNDFHRMIGEFDPEQFVTKLVNRQSNHIDLIQVNLNHDMRFALNIAGCGFDGYVVNLLDKQREKWKIGGKISYAFAILRAFFLFKKSKLSIKTDAFDYDGKALLIVACNGSTFGHGLVVYPEARLNSGKIGVTLFGDVSLWDYIKYLRRIKKGIKIKHPEVHYLETDEMSINAGKSNLFVECDGELISSGNPEFKIVPRAIQLVY